MNRRKTITLRICAVLAVVVGLGWAFKYYAGNQGAPPIPPQVAEPMVELCRIGGIDAITREHVSRLLQKNNFRWGAQGSLMNASICVEKSKLEQAIELLNESAHNAAPSITVSRQTDNALWVRSHYGESFEKTFNQHVDALQKTDHGFYSQILHAVGNSDRSYLHGKRLPIVKRMSGAKCTYLGADNSLMTGYFVEIQLADQQPQNGAHYTENYQVWDQFREVQFIGGHGGGDLPQ